MPSGKRRVVSFKGSVKEGDKKCQVEIEQVPQEWDP